jgi:hypothetical protein
VAGPGDTVEVVDKVLFVNGKEFPNPDESKFEDVRKPGDNFGPYVVPPKSYFMMGDNRDNSYDSRFWGPVRREYILGEAMMIHWSWDDSRLAAPEVSATDPLSVPRMFVFNAIHFFEKVRWGRLMNVIS